jgi:hypothetical protein
MAAIGLYRPEFKIPRLKIIYESVPVIEYSEMDTARLKDLVGTLNPNKTILRIHVIDQNAQAHPGEQLVIDTLAAGSAVSLFSNFTAGGSLSDISQVLADVQSDGVITSDFETQGTSDADSLKIMAAATSRDAIHKYVKTRVPTIQVGTAFSPFSDVSISGMSSGAVFDALLSNTFREREDPNDQTAAATGIEEVTVVPVTAKASGLGNPMFHYGQQFYLDLKTGTTADNIYTVRSVTHNISPGKFTSDVDFAPAGTQGTVSAVRANLIAALGTIDRLGGQDTRTLDGGPVERRSLGELLVDEGVSDAADQIEGLRGNLRASRIARREARAEERAARDAERRLVSTRRLVDDEMSRGRMGEIQRRIDEINAAYPEESSMPDAIAFEYADLLDERYTLIQAEITPRTRTDEELGLRGQESDATDRGFTDAAADETYDFAE